MACDINKLITRLHDFYDFRDKTILSVGAGGGQLIEYARFAKKIWAIDVDRVALDHLKIRVDEKGWFHKYELVHGDFLDFQQQADVVLFEFCLHEMPFPAKAVEHALSLAPDVLACDHMPNSDWAYVVDETEKATQSWDALTSFSFRKQEEFDDRQLFDNYEELYHKVAVQGERAIERIQRYKDQKPISISMKYGFVLV